MRLVPLSLCVALLAGCGSQRAVKYNVKSVPEGAQIDVNQIAKCDTTPCTITLVCKQRWVGLANSPNGWEPEGQPHTVTAIPQGTMSAPPGGRLYEESKTIQACDVPDGETGSLRFNLIRGERVQTIEIRNR